MNCPACGYYNPPASMACGHCSRVLPGAVGDARCPAHPGVQAIGTCSRCGTFGCETCLSARGPDWLCAACAQLSALPWDERATLGVWRAWWRTSTQMISAPYQTLQRAQAEAPLGSSMFFALLSAMVAVGPSVLLLIPWSWLTAPSAQSDLPEAVLGRVVGGVLGMVMVMVMMVLYHLGALLLFSGCEHLALAALGGQPKSYSVTVRGHALGMSAYLIGLLPFCSFYVYPVWAMVLRVFAMNVFHRTTPGRAAAAVLLPVVVLCGGGLALYVAVIALAVGASR